MFAYKFKVYINDVWFDSLFGTDYYYDKRNFFVSGAKQFFTIYQILKTGDYAFTIVEENSGERTEIKNTENFRRWTEDNYDGYLNYLDNAEWDKHPESKLEVELQNQSANRSEFD